MMARMTTATVGRRCYLALVTLVLCLFASCSGDFEPRGRVLIIGLDGASPKALDFLFAQGRLPNLKRLADEGAYGPLRSLLPLLSPRIWTTVATGKLPDDHGILGWTYKDEGGKDRLYLGRHRRGAALWNIASHAGMRVGVIQWWATFPPEVVNGVFVSDHAGRRAKTASLEIPADHENMVGATVSPADWEGRILQTYKDPPTLPGLAKGTFSPRALFGADADKPIPAPIARIPTYVTGIYNHDRAALAIALAVEDAIRPDLLMVLFPGIDRASHLFWVAFEPPEDLPLSPEARKASVDVLFRVYDYADTMVGLLLDHFGPDDLILVMSDHGFESTTGGVFTGGGHETEAAQDGILLARGPDIPPGARTEGVRIQDITPTVLAWWGLPVADDMAGQPASFLAGVDPQSVPTYDDIPVERAEIEASGAEASILEALRALGYVR